jgi:AraC-like DNA-binding protein
MRELTSQWSLRAGSNPVLAGRLNVKGCDAHFHDTYTIALMREGKAVMKMRERSHLWVARNVFLANPYELHERRSGEACTHYEVIYPNAELIRAGLGVSARDERLPLFTRPILPDSQVAVELALIMSASLDSNPGKMGGAAEEQLIGFIRRHACAIGLRLVEPHDYTPVRTACRIMQETLDSCVDLSALAGEVGYSRFYFTRLFHKVTGVPPNVYLLQLRLARARQLLCSGHSPAEAANASGFADQAHMTRAFKRFFCTTPGKFVRDLFPRVVGTA